MADRKRLQEELNRINTLYHEKDLELQKAGGSLEQRQAMRDMLNKKKESLASEFGDDLMKLNSGKGIRMPNTAKRILGIVPGAGAAMAALQGEPAMAAEEALMDIPGAEAMRSEDAGMSSGDERQMLAEIQAQKNYQQSPARMDKLRKILGK